MKFQTFTALSLLSYSAATASFAATSHTGSASSQAEHAQAENSTRSSLQTVASGVSGDQTIRSVPLDLLKVNGIEGPGVGNVVGNGRNALLGTAQDAVQTAASAEPGTLAMLLTGLGVMGSIARRRRLARKAA